MLEAMGLDGSGPKKQNVSADVLKKAVEDTRLAQKKAEQDYGSKIDFIATQQQREEMIKRKMQDKVQSVMKQVVKDREEDLDKELEAMENLDLNDVRELQKKRLLELRKKEKLISEWKSKNHGVLTTVVDQGEFFQHVKQSQFVVCLFFKTANKWCDLLRDHLKVIARSHLETRFLEIEGEKAPYLCRKLNVFMMPTLVLCKDNKVNQQCNGLDPFNPTGQLTSALVEQRLYEWGFLVDYVLEGKKKSKKTGSSSTAVRAVEDDSDSELDL